MIFLGWFLIYDDRFAVCTCENHLVHRALPDDAIMMEPPRASSFVGWCHHDGTTACIELCRMMPSWFSCSRIPPDGFQGMDYEWSVQEITSIRRFRSEEHKADHRRRGWDDDAAGSCKSSMAADGCALWQESVCNKNTKTDQKMPVPTTVLSRLSCSKVGPNLLLSRFLSNS